MLDGRDFFVVSLYARINLFPLLINTPPLLYIFVLNWGFWGWVFCFSNNVRVHIGFGGNGLNCKVRE